MKTEKGNNGCLWFFVLGLLSSFSYGLLKSLLPISNGFAITIAVSLSLLLLKFTLGQASFKRMIRAGFTVILVLIALQYSASYLLKKLIPEPDVEVFTEEDTIDETQVIKEKDTLIVYSNHRYWRDNYGNSYEGDLQVRKKDYLQLKDRIKHYQPKSEETFWADLYQYLADADTPSLDLIIDTFNTIHLEKKLNQREFAEMVVSCIQDIPYSFVFQKECPTVNFDIDTKHILEKCPECCIGNKLYGIQNPVSFMKNLKGDCDTRTVLIYCILNYFNYDVAILNSVFYRHSIIGINLPISGTHKIYKGKKYALWETTAKYYEPGYLAPGFDDVNHWDVILTSK